MRLNGISKRVTFCILACMIVVGCSKKPERLEPPPPKVTVAHPQVGDYVEFDEFNGWLESKTVAVRARVRGHIMEVKFSDGDVVRAGQPLFQLDPAPLKDELDRATESKNVYVAQKVASVKEETRLRELEKIGGASQSQIDKADADTKSFDAQIKAADAEIARRTKELGYATVKAEIKEGEVGIIGEAQLRKGDLVNAGGSDPLLATIVLQDPLYVYFYVDERTAQSYVNAKKFVEARDTEEGKRYDLKERNIKFYFKLDSDADFVHSGTLDYCDPYADPTTGTIKVRGTVDAESRKDKALVSGFRARVKLPISKPRKALFIPATAVLSDQDRKYVLAVDGNNVVQRRNVTLGNRIDKLGRQEVKPSTTKGEGLTADDRIIVQGLLSARINYPVEPVAPAPDE